jgi:type I restriction enzyme S subunit
MDTNLHEWDFMGKLLDGVEVECKALEEVGDVLRGKRLTKKELSHENRFPVFHGELHTAPARW